VAAWPGRPDAGTAAPAEPPGAGACGYPRDDPGPEGGGYPREDPGPEGGGYPRDDPGPEGGGYPRDDPGPEGGGYPRDDPGPEGGGYPREDPGPEGQRRSPPGWSAGVTAAPWAPGAATGVGSMPGEDMDAAVRLVLGELSVPYLPELPARGLGADLVGRGVAHLAELHADVQPSGWRLVDRPGRDEARARDLLEADLDVLAVAGADWNGPFKVQVAGPWTLAAALELPRGHRVLSDAGAVRDLTDALAEGTVRLLTAVSRRLPAARLICQVDEPGLPGVLAGRIPTPSGWGRVRVVAEPDAEAGLARVLAACSVVPAVPAVHCCADDAPLRLFRSAGATAVSLDLTRFTDEDALGEFVDGGGWLIAGTVPALGPGVAPAVRELADPLRRLWRRLGFAPETLAERVAVSPTCGLAGASPGWVRTALDLCRRSAQLLAEAPESAR